MQTSSHWRYIYKGKQLQTFFINGPKYEQMCILAIWMGPVEACNNQTGPILLSNYPLTHIWPYLCICKIRKQYDKNFLSLNPKYDYYFSYLGGYGGPLRQTQGYQNFTAVRSHHRADICITRGKYNHQFFIYGPNVFVIFGYSRGPRWPTNNQTGPILLPSYPPTYINLHIQYGSNPIRIC